MSEIDNKESDFTEEIFEYTVGDRVFVQKALVIAQTKMLVNLLRKVEMPEKLDIAVIVEAIAEQASMALAIVLIEKGKETPEDLKNRDLKSMEDYFEFAANTVVIARVVTDFLSCNPVTLVLSLLRSTVLTMYSGTQNMIDQAQGKTESQTQMKTSTGLTDSSSISPEGT